LLKFYLEIAYIIIIMQSFNNNDSPCSMFVCDDVDCIQCGSAQHRHV